MMRGKHWRGLVLACGVSWLCVTGWAQTPLQRALTGKASGDARSTVATNTVTGESVEVRLAKVRAELATLKRTDDEPPDMIFQRTALQRLVRLYEQQISYAAELETLKKNRAEMTQEAKAWTGFAEPRPYSVLVVDTLREAIRAERLEVANAEAAFSILNQLTEENRTLLKESEEKIRQLNEHLESGADKEGWTRERELERLRSQVGAATIAVLNSERQVREERLGISRDRLKLLERQLLMANAEATFSEADMRKILELLDAEDRQIESELTQAQARRSAALKAIVAAQEELRQVQARNETNAFVLAQVQELVEVRRTQLETSDTGVRVLQFIAQAGTIGRTMWQARFASYRSRSGQMVREAERRLEYLRGQVELWRSYYRSQLDAASLQVTLQEERLAMMDTNSVLAPLVRERLDSLRERDQYLLRIVRQIDRGDRLLRHWEDGVRDASKNLPIWTRARNAVSDTGSWLSRLWNLEFFVAQDTIVVDGQSITGKRSITLGKIVSAILILVVGYWLTGWISHVVEPVVVKRFKIDVNQANLIRRWVRVVLVLALAIFSLVSVKIPLTVFAFAGGALAIALGFGMQTMLKNFVSGIMLLFERPFRVGDMLDVAGQRGTVVAIGIRSSVLQQADGTEMLIPNSTLLESTVTNCTYSNRKVRFIVKVGVAYGSDTRRVVQLLTEVAERHGLVEKNPPPQVLFMDFADSALIFEVRFWVDVISTNAAQIASDLRQMVAVTFDENKIVMAFPQRDIHMDTASPLRVQILPIPEAGEAAIIEGNGSSEHAAPTEPRASSNAPGEPETKPLKLP